MPVFRLVYTRGHHPLIVVVVNKLIFLFLSHSSNTHLLGCFIPFVIEFKLKDTDAEIFKTFPLLLAYWSIRFQTRRIDNPSMPVPANANVTTDIYHGLSCGWQMYLYL